MAVALVRCIILYGIVIILYRVMGKRQIGEMQPGELVLAIMISDIASVPMQAVSTPLVNGIIPIVVLTCAEITMSFISQKSHAFRKIISGKPSLVISDGQIVIEEMERLRFNIDDLFEELRVAGYFDISEVSFAVLETNGNLSVLPKEMKRPLTLGDMKESAPCAVFPSNIIKDGQIDQEALKEIGKDEQWVKKELEKQGIKNKKSVFLRCADKFKVTYIQKKGKR